ncbi:MAG: hypothetical protein GXO55_00925 [Chloroflexi bacterium]|nr:hypothetical protein [Chloroflexota bacterium]
MKVVTYNIHYWAGLNGQMNLDAVRHILREVDADVIGLNEVLHPLITPRGHRFPLVELANSLGMYWAFGPSFEQREHTRFWPGVLGNAVLSRYPIRYQRNIPLREVPTRKPRTLFHVRLDVGGHFLSVLITHLDHLLASVRRVQFETVLRHLQRIHEPHMLMGDFNTHTPTRSRWWKGELVIRQLRRLGYVDAFARAGHGKGHSYPSLLPLVRLDYIWIPEQWAWTVTRARVVEHEMTRRASDHLPVCVFWHWEMVRERPHLTPAYAGAGDRETSSASTDSS